MKRLTFRIIFLVICTQTCFASNHDISDAIISNEKAAFIAYYLVEDAIRWSVDGEWLKSHKKDRVSLKGEKEFMDSMVNNMEVRWRIYRS